VGVYDHDIPVQVYAVDEIDCGHGRVEQRKCSVIADLGLIEKAAEWALLKGLVRIESGRTTRPRAKPNAKSATTSPALQPMGQG
jgi:hypothetical protein